MKSLVDDLLAMAGLESNPQVYAITVLAIIALISLLVHIILHRVVFRFVSRGTDENRSLWKRALVNYRLFPRLAFALQGVILYVQARIWLDIEGQLFPLIEVLTLEWVLFFMLLALYSLLSALEGAAMAAGIDRRFPVRGLNQSIKLLSAIVAIIVAVSLLIGKSPVILFSGLGAMTAVMLLVFKDPILGLVAGIQLSANNMLSTGDWLEMPHYGADGDVIDINLTTVKVRNWDKTITSIPSYALISDHFRNWRGIEEAGGRRIKRAVNIDVSSVRFLDEEAIKRLSRLQLISDYLADKAREVDDYNESRGVNRDSPVNGRHLTNLGTFRAYLSAYIRSQEGINPDLMRMVRQLEPGPNGVPVEVYCFSSSTDWTDYETLQSDLFDHILAVIPEFDLRIHQTPSGNDIRQLIPEPRDAEHRSPETA